MRVLLMFSVAVSVGLTSSAAEANMVQPSQDADSAARKDDGSGKTAVYDFDDDNVSGEVLRPGGANISARGRGKHPSLITIRPHFIPEMITLANDI